MEVFKNESIILENSKLSYAENYATYRVSVSETLNKTLISYQEREGFSKTLALETLIIKALQELGLLGQDETPITPLSSSGVGRNSFKAGSVVITGKTSLETHNAIMKFKGSSNETLRDTKSTLIQKLLIIGFRIENVKIQPN